MYQLRKSYRYLVRCYCARHRQPFRGNAGRVRTRYSTATCTPVLLSFVRYESAYHRWKRGSQTRTTVSRTRYGCGSYEIIHHRRHRVVVERDLRHDGAYGYRLEAESRDTLRPQEYCCIMGIYVRYVFVRTSQHVPARTRTRSQYFTSPSDSGR